MEVGSVSEGSASLQTSQSNQRQDVNRQDEAQRQAELETSQPAASQENNPTPNSRVGSVINTQA